MRETGKVVKIDKKLTFVRINKKTECESCKMCMFRKNENYVDVKTVNNVNAKIGDTVLISNEKGSELFSALILYGIPLIFAILGMFVGNFFGSEKLMLILCLVFLIFGYILITVIDKLYSRKKGVVSIIEKIIDKKEEEINEQNRIIK